MSTSLPAHPGDLLALSPHECVARLHAAPWIRVGFSDADGHQHIYPVTHLLIGGAITFRTSPGSLLALAVRGDRVALQVDGGDPDHRVGWSVLARGPASLITDEAELEQLHSLPFEPWAVPGEKPYWVRVELEDVSGRRIVRAA